jgi:hypothetical protein
MFSSSRTATTCGQAALLTVLVGGAVTGVAALLLWAIVVALSVVVPVLR